MKWTVSADKGLGLPGFGQARVGINRFVKYGFNRNLNQIIIVVAYFKIHESNSYVMVSYLHLSFVGCNNIPTINK